MRADHYIVMTNPSSVQCRYCVSYRMGISHFLRSGSGVILDYFSCPIAMTKFEWNPLSGDVTYAGWQNSPNFGNNINS